MPPSLRPHLRPLLFAGIAGSVAGCVLLGYYYAAPFASSDMDQIWWAARALVHGQNPYATIRTTDFPFPLYYPLTAAIAGLPLGFISLEAARAVFVAGGAALFGFAVGRTRPYLWPTFLGLPFLVCARSGNWSAILTAAMLLPSLGWLAAAKPNVGVAMLAGARTRRDALVIVGGGAVLVGVSLIVNPRWPWEWREALAASTHFHPLIMRPGGFIMLVALLCWRDPDARLLLALAVVPQTGFFYEELPACLVARDRKQAAIIALCTHIATVTRGFFPAPHGFNDHAWQYGTVSLWLGLVPPLAIVLHRRFRRVPFPVPVSTFPASEAGMDLPQARKDIA
ncbi:MAG: hypothetical protein ACREL3_08265 [Gemmatimonadales bacterium]